MTQDFNPSRRSVLRALGGVPMLPLASSLAGIGAATTALSASAAESMATWEVVSANFVGMAAPTLADPAAMATTTVQSSLIAKLKNGGQRKVDLGWEAFFLTGQTVPQTGGGSIVAGGYVDIGGSPIIDSTGTTPMQFFSDCPDGMSLVTVKGAKPAGVTGNPVFAVVQFEYTSLSRGGDSMYGRLPSPIAVLTLDQNPKTGKLSLVSYHEYEPDAWTIASNTQFAAYSENLYGDAAAAKPYHYGHLPEVTVHKDGTGSIVKHYCMGRISHELVEVMPDQRTVLMGDDATNGGLFMFVADKKKDLSAGTLYAAKWIQTSAANGGSADLQWVKLGHATSDEIEAMADTLSATDIMDVATTDPGDASYTMIPFSGKTQWVRFKPGMEKAAAFLETHRYAAVMGASLGFTKMEGTTVNAADKIAYSAISYVQTAMTNGSGGISIEGPQAGMVYAWPMDGGQKDTAGDRIRSKWVPVSGHPLVIGEDLATPDALGNTSSADKIANPDNIKFSERLRTLFIGEDSGRHVNNFLWAYNVDAGTLTRILSCPAGAESTGLQAADDVNGFVYICSNFQHPGDWDKTGLHAVVWETLDPLVRANYDDLLSGGVGYITNSTRPVKA